MENRYLPVFDDNGAYVNNPGLTLLALMNCPEDETEASQFRQIIQAESEAKLNAPNRDQSEITQSILNRYARRLNRGDLSGYVTLFIAELHSMDKKVSLTRAIASTVAFAGDADEQFGAGLPLSERDVRKHFYKYKNGAHFWAARLQFPETFLAAGSTLGGLAEFMGYARIYQDHLEAVLDPQTKWHPWRVPPCFLAPARPVRSPMPKKSYIDEAQ